MARQTKTEKRLKELKVIFNDDDIASVAYEHFRKITPIAPVKGGNARKNTKKEGNVINADYPYAGRLDKGYSKQAPDGMTQPTWEFVKEYIKKKVG